MNHGVTKTKLVLPLEIEIITYVEKANSRTKTGKSAKLTILINPLRYRYAEDEDSARSSWWNKTLKYSNVHDC